MDENKQMEMRRQDKKMGGEEKEIRMNERRKARYVMGREESKTEQSTESREGD